MGDSILTSEIYGWHTDEGNVFLYIQAIDGVTLEELWSNIAEEECFRLCRELRIMFDAMRSLRQHAHVTFIGKPMSETVIKLEYQDVLQVTS